jgi:hypothetical protein
MQYGFYTHKTNKPKKNGVVKKKLEAPNAAAAPTSPAEGMA